MAYLLGILCVLFWVFFRKKINFFYHFLIFRYALSSYLFLPFKETVNIFCCCIVLPTVKLSGCFNQFSITEQTPIYSEYR